MLETLKPAAPDKIIEILNRIAATQNGVPLPADCLDAEQLGEDGLCALQMLLGGMAVE